MLRWPPHDPDEELDYRVNWTDSLDQGDTISSSEWILVEAAGVTLGVEENTTVLTTVWITGGTRGKTARALNRVVTAAGRTMDITVALPIRAK